jgi:hypothetical protein
MSVPALEMIVFDSEDRNRGSKPRPAMISKGAVHANVYFVDDNLTSFLLCFQEDFYFAESSGPPSHGILCHHIINLNVPYLLLQVHT